MRENRPSGSEGGGIETNRCFLPLSSTSHGDIAKWMDARVTPAHDDRVDQIDREPLSIPEAQQIA